MSQNQDANDFLMGVGIPSAKFPEIGAAVTGTVTREPELQQQTDFDDGTPLTWNDGSPRMQAKVVLATEQRDPEIPDDDGSRAIYVKAALQKAVAAAVRAAGAKRLEVGGKLTVTYTADGPKEGKKNAPKMFAAKYEPPDPLAATADQSGAASQEPAGPGGSTFVSSNVTGDDSPPSGVDPAAWANLSTEQKATLRAAMGQQATAF